MNEGKKVVKKRRRKLKVGYILALIIILFVVIMGIKMILPSTSSKYGDRLDGIKDIKFTKNDQKKLLDKIKSSDKVTDASMEIKGKLITVIFNVNKDTSKDDARAIANDSLGEFSDKVKGFYDIQYMISKKDEEGTKETKEDGTEVVKKEFPIMGYKIIKSSGIVW